MNAEAPELLSGPKGKSKIFEDFKNIFKRNIELQHVNWNMIMYLTTNASLSSIGAWIGQLNKNEHLIHVFLFSIILVMVCDPLWQYNVFLKDIIKMF